MRLLLFVVKMRACQLSLLLLLFFFRLLPDFWMYFVRTCSTPSMVHRVGAFNLMISTHSESVGAEAIELDIIFISNSKFDA